MIFILIYLTYMLYVPFECNYILGLNVGQNFSKNKYFKFSFFVLKILIVLSSVLSVVGIFFKDVNKDLTISEVYTSEIIILMFHTVLLGILFFIKSESRK